MRLCRFRQDDRVAPGFFFDDRVIPLGRASAAYQAAANLEHGSELDSFGSTDDLLGFLPPDGPMFLAASALSAWLDQLSTGERAG